VEEEEEDKEGQEERKAGKVAQLESAGLKSMRSLPVKEGLRLLLAPVVCDVSVVGSAAVKIFVEGDSVTVFDGWSTMVFGGVAISRTFSLLVIVSSLFSSLTFPFSTPISDPASDSSDSDSELLSESSSLLQLSPLSEDLFFNFIHSEGFNPSPTMGLAP